MKSPVTAAVVICALGAGAWAYLQPRSTPPTQQLTSSSASQAAGPSAPVALPAAPEAASSKPVVAPAAATNATAGEPMSEELLATAMHALEQSNPARALEMARQGLRQWPQSERAPEFARTEVKCLYALGKPSEGRGAAEAMVNKYVGTPWALEVERETGAHPHVNH